MDEKRIHKAIRKAGGTINADGSITLANDAQFRAAVAELHRLVGEGRQPDQVAKWVERYSNLEPLPDGKAIPNAEQVRLIVREELERAHGVPAADGETKPKGDAHE